jgi:N-acetylmuramoyl-L-alanine amidase
MQIKNSTIGLFLILLIASCVSNPAKKSIALYKKQLKGYIKTIAKKEAVLLNGVTHSTWTPTVNFNLRKPNFVIIHYTFQDSLLQTITTFRSPRTQVSAHYVIGVNGEVVQMLNDYLRAWHGGDASWGKNTDINSASIGIELDNNGSEIFSDAQINSLLILLEKLKKDYEIPTTNFIGHSDIAPTRKHDPGALFPWKKLAEKGFGLWADEILEPAPQDFNAEWALRIIGYDTRNLAAAIIAFKYHYMQDDINDVLDDRTKNTIYAIFKKQ